MFIGIILFSGCSILRPGAPLSEAEREVPSPEREFRGVWVATVANIDWPSEPGLSTAEQKQEILTILETATRANLNAVILQVRPQCDAFYPSEFEPWSYFLTGEQGKPPEPYYDPLAFWIDESHKRGLELHIWCNPYRAHHPMSGDVTGTSIVKRRPDIVKALKNGYYWMDPAKKGTQDHSLDVVMDVVKRYDIDGVHFDDYFYPYPSYNDGEDFPDDDSWEEYRENGGQLTRGDWRRDNVNRFIKRLYSSIKKEKPHVKFGISPFGIWRPHYPESILGFDQYDVLYADAKLWLNEGWVDYFTPQLYWPISQYPQSYPVLLGWWVRENRHGRNLWPGLYTTRVSGQGKVDENINQIMVTRGFVPEGPGNIHFSMKALVENVSGITDSLANGPYRLPALVPPSRWLDDKPPAAPRVSVSGSGRHLDISWMPGDGEAVFRWVVYLKQEETWRYDILGPDRRSYSFQAIGGDDNGELSTIGARWWIMKGESVEPVTMVAVSAVDRMGNESRRAVVTVGE